MIPAKIIKIDVKVPKKELLHEAVKVLEHGGIVILPTETVYGVAVNALDKNAVDRLSAIKKRPKDKPFSLLIASKEQVEELARGVSISSYKLIDKFWPGPLTLVLESSKGETVGIRMPSHEVTLRILELAGFPLACPSANLSGEPAPKNFNEAFSSLGNKVDLAIDSGDSVLGIESTVVDAVKQPEVVLRQGAIKKEDIDKAISTKNILFICTGNSCRSVMAEALLKKKMLEKNRTDVEVSSAGIMLFGGLEASGPTKEVLAREGMDVTAHRSKRVTPLMIKKSDLILVMEKVHEQGIVQLVPEARSRVFLLKEFAKIDNLEINIADPIGRTITFYENTLKVIKEAVERVAELI